VAAEEEQDTASAKPSCTCVVVHVVHSYGSGQALKPGAEPDEMLCLHVQVRDMHTSAVG
jgi:hypothetical protein